MTLGLGYVLERDSDREYKTKATIDEQTPTKIRLPLQACNVSMSSSKLELKIGKTSANIKLTLQGTHSF